MYIVLRYIILLYTWKYSVKKNIPETSSHSSSTIFNYFQLMFFEAYVSSYNIVLFATKNIGNTTFFKWINCNASGIFFQDTNTHESSFRVRKVIILSRKLNSCLILLHSLAKRTEWLLVWHLGEWRLSRAARPTLSPSAALPPAPAPLLSHIFWLGVLGTLEQGLLFYISNT